MYNYANNPLRTLYIRIYRLCKMYAINMFIVLFIRIKEFNHVIFTQYQQFNALKIRIIASPCGFFAQNRANCAINTYFYNMKYI